MNQIKSSMKKVLVALFLTLAPLAFFSSCAGPVQTPGHGAVRGAAVGAVIGNQFRSGGSGARGRGAAIGAATGMAIGGSRAHRNRAHRGNHFRRQHHHHRW
ncbi:MAG: hypothetical protein ACR2RV_23180 [Verrucomicrobiales bacterium]